MYKRPKEIRKARREKKTSDLFLAEKEEKWGVGEELLPVEGTLFFVVCGASHRILTK